MEIKVYDASDLQYILPNKEAILMQVLFEHLPSPVQFIARPDDTEAHGRQLYQRALDGDFGPIAEYIAPTVSTEHRASVLKSKVEEVLTQKSLELGFDSLSDAMTYCDEPVVPEYQQKAIALRKWRSLVWAWYDAAVASGADADVATMESMPSFS